MFKHLMPAVRVTLVLTVLTGALYPALVTGLAKAVFPHQANGSLIEVNGKVIGSELIGQKFTKPQYFQGRPSAAGDGYDASNSGGTNLGPTSQKLADRIKTDAVKFRKDNPDFSGSIPSDLLTTSASGFDPDLSPASAWNRRGIRPAAHERLHARVRVDFKNGGRAGKAALDAGRRHWP